MYHYFKLAFHSFMFLGMLVLYIINRVHGIRKIYDTFDYTQIVLACMWVVFMVEMVFRFFPSKIESMGCQKVFKHNYVPAKTKKEPTPQHQSWKRTLLVAVVWIAFNAVFGALYCFGIFDDGIMILISLAYSVCDMICILFFCPFQTWFMKNKCCNTCRIYNWDYAMMVTPLLFIPNVFTWALVLVSILLLIHWEMVYKIHPERFAENTNQNLRCANCKEKLCHHKKQLQGYLLKFREFYEQKLIPYFTKQELEEMKEESYKEKQETLNQETVDVASQTSAEKSDKQAVQEIVEEVKMKKRKKATN